MSTKFTNSQLDAINSRGNVLVVASAGSGKTSVYVNRIAQMVKEGIEPENILAVTFTKKAANEMLSRLTKLIGEDYSSRVMMGTFHSIAYRMLVSCYSDYGKKEFAKDWWTLKTVSEICKAKDGRNYHGMDLVSDYGMEATKVLLKYMSDMKNQGLLPNEESKHYDEKLNAAYSKFEYLKRNANYIVMNDLLLDFSKRLKDDKRFREFCGSRFKYIMIDEFQDSSGLMLEIVKLINQEQVFVVGDFRQSIYHFIGADVNNIFEFGNNFSNVEVIQLTDNFRSTNEIVTLCNRIIENGKQNSYNSFKPSESRSNTKGQVKYTEHGTEESEASHVVSVIEEQLTKGKNPNEIAILLRTNAQIGVYEEILTDKGIAYDVTSNGSYFKRGEVLDMFYYLKSAFVGDNTSVRRVVNRPFRFISNKYLSEADEESTKKGVSLIETMKQSNNKNVQQFLSLLDKYRRMEDNPSIILKEIVRDTNYYLYIDDNSFDREVANVKKENVKKLIKIAKKFNSTKSFIRFIEEMDSKPNDVKKDGVKLMTIHSSKGLEYESVFVPSLVQGVLPHQNAIDEFNTEEERRLFYVACSRAKEYLQISRYKMNGDNNVQPVEQSEFLVDLRV